MRTCILTAIILYFYPSKTHLTLLRTWLYVRKGWIVGENSYRKNHGGEGGRGLIYTWGKYTNIEKQRRQVKFNSIYFFSKVGRTRQFTAHGSHLIELLILNVEEIFVFQQSFFRLTLFETKHNQTVIHAVDFKIMFEAVDRFPESGDRYP